MSPLTNLERFRVAHVTFSLLRAKNPNLPLNSQNFTKTLTAVDLLLSFLSQERQRERQRETMKVVAAFLLAKLGGNENPSVDDLKKIFESVGAEIDQEKIDLFFSLIKDRDVTELIAVGREKMAALSSGGPAVAVASGGGGGAAPAAEPKAAESKKKEEEKEESEDDGGMMSLFD
ncbi:hypothetical protein CARUB_v10005874mg [Capsella rubella]|uniref:60S acidic ribosomal protein P2 n=2 Tax=Capsella rubella TaxID=81985 RepID=R0GL02_9BRAS|nr:hypothetical protein CARUB_v10005874mg [Capsella rubella]